MPLYEMQIFFVRNDVECLTDFEPISLRHFSKLKECHALAALLRKNDSKHPCAYSHRFHFTRHPAEVPMCVHCDEPGADCAHDGQAFHQKCYEEWQTEYTAYLDKQISIFIAGETFHPEPSKPAKVKP